MNLVEGKDNRSVVVRITDICNNRCEHCCFSCGPENKLRMEVSTAVEINRLFADTDGTAWWFNVMGGEPTILDNYEEIVESFAGRNVRLVTNGWWIDRDNHRDRFLKFLKGTKARIRVGVSRDKFHPKGVGERAFAYLMSQNIEDDWGLTTPNPDDEEGSIASVGRAYHNYIGYMLSTFGCYCQSSNTRDTSFTVLEDGTVTHCPFAIWPIGRLSSGLELLDSEKIRLRKMWNEKVDSCRHCYEMWMWTFRARFINKGFDIFGKMDF